MAKRFIPEIAERRYRENMDKRINKLCKEGVITDAKVDHVEALSPQALYAEGKLAPARGVRPEEALRRLAGGEAKED